MNLCNGTASLSGDGLAVEGVSGNLLDLLLLRWWPVVLQVGFVHLERKEYSMGFTSSLNLIIRKNIIL
jgi:hypothetical protein